MFDSLSIPDLVNDIRSLSAECVALKRVLRVPWIRPMGAEQRLHARLSRRLTELFILRAWLRGKLHVTSRPRGFGGDTWDPRAHALGVAERVAKDLSAGHAAAVREAS